MLAGHFDVIAVDLPGFGDSAPLPDAVEPHPATEAVQTPARVNVTCVTPLGEEVASIS